MNDSRGTIGKIDELEEEVAALPQKEQQDAKIEEKESWPGRSTKRKDTRNETMMSTRMMLTTSCWGQ
jgi:hypothetical protein